MAKVRVHSAEIEKATFGPDDEIVVEGPDALKAVHELRAGGIDPVRLSYMADGAERHFHWDLARRADEINRFQGATRFMSCGFDDEIGESIIERIQHDSDLEKRRSAMGRIIRWRYPEVVVTAGPFGAGKSLFAQILAMNFVKANDAPVLFCCWEDQEEEIVASLERFRDTVLRGSPIQKDFLQRFHIVRVDPEKDRLMSEYIGLCEYYNKRFGVKHIVLDPWNEFDHQKNTKQTETEYVREVMKEIRKTANRLSSIINIVTHVSAEFIDNKGGFTPFRLSNAFGSVQFANKADRGFCVTRASRWAQEGGSHMIVRQDKVKQESKMTRPMMGVKATMALHYSDANSQLYYDRMVSESEEVRKLWR